MTGSNRRLQPGYGNFAAVISCPARGLLHYVWQLESETAWDELSVVGDNTPLYVMAIPAILELFPNAKFIHMVRDPRDVVCSMLNMRFGACEAVTAAMEWHQTLGCWLLAERLIPESQRMECRYEDLCTSPEATFGGVASFVGATAEAARSHPTARRRWPEAKRIRSGCSKKPSSATGRTAESRTGRAVSQRPFEETDPTG
ncbi:MAG UNVERIFIED_CONTAM: sulfotransferase [Planctomycetaceae bacterium]